MSIKGFCNYMIKEINIQNLKIFYNLLLPISKNKMNVVSLDVMSEKKSILYYAYSNWPEFIDKHNKGDEIFTGDTTVNEKLIDSVFSLTYRQKEWLFNRSYGRKMHSKYNTKRQILARLKYLIINGDVPENWGINYQKQIKSFLFIIKDERYLYRELFTI